MTSGLVFNVQRFSLHDGPGLRTTVFLKGCPLHCAWCHNPESQSGVAAFVRLRHRCMACGRCSPDELDRPEVHGRTDADVEACPTGALQSVGETVLAAALVRTLLRDRIFFDESGGGVTVSGGEPMRQPRFVVDLLGRLKAEGVHTALDTCGYCRWDDLAEAARVADLVLFDLKLMDDARHREATGVSNGLILDNLRALAATHRGLWIRIPVVPGVNDDGENMAATASFVAALPGVRRVDLLPYHPTGEAKFARVGMVYGLHGTATPDSARLESVAAPFRATGLHTTIGGRS